MVKTQTEYYELKEKYVKLLESKLELNEKYDNLIEDKKVKFELTKGIENSELFLEAKRLTDRWFIDQPLNNDSYLNNLPVEEYKINKLGKEEFRIIPSKNNLIKNKASFVFILREDILYVTPEKFILLYFDRLGLQSFEYLIKETDYNNLLALFNDDSVKNTTMALGYAFEIKNGCRANV